MSVFKLRVEPELIRRASLFWMFVLETYWITLVLVAKPAPSAGSVQVLTVVIGMAVALAGWRAGAALADGVRVLTSLRTPAALWHAWLRKIAITLATRWALAVIAGTVAVMRHGAPWMWSGPVALYSAVLVVALVASIAQRGLWHWVWAWLIADAVAIAIALARWRGLDAWMTAAPAGHLALALVCMGATAAVLAHWATPPLSASGGWRAQPFEPARRVIHFCKRYALLKPVGQRTPQGKDSAWLGLMMVLPAGYAMVGRAVALKAHWGAAVGPLYLVSLLALVAFAHTTIACKDLHWRRLLAPHGFGERRLGWHIIWSTLAVNAAVALVIAACVGAVLAALSWAGMAIAPAALLEAASKHGVVVFEYLMAICIAAAVASLRRPALVYMGALLVFGALAVGGIRWFGVSPLATLFVIGPAYVACLLAVSALAIVVANRLWTKQRLLPYLVTRAPQDDEPTVRGRLFNWPGRSY